MESFSQNILEKFEFFPVKCRVQRALEIGQINKRKEESLPHTPPFKTKVFAVAVLPTKVVAVAVMWRCCHAPSRLLFSLQVV